MVSQEDLDEEETPFDAYFNEALTAFEYGVSRRVFKQYWEKADAPPCKRGHTVYRMKDKPGISDEDYFGCKGCGTGNDGWFFWDEVVDKYHLCF